MLAPSSAAPLRWWLHRHPGSLLPHRLPTTTALTTPPHPSPERRSLQHVRHLSFGRWLKKKTSDASSSSSKTASSTSASIGFATKDIRAPCPPLGVREETRTLHGETWRDPFAWLEEESSPRVQRYLEEEHSYTMAMMKDSMATQKELYREMASRVQPEDTIPEEMEGYLYYLRHVEGENFPIYCRRKVGSSQEEVVLDQNKEARGHPFIHINLMKVSPSKTMLAFTMDVTGDDTFSAYVRTLSYHPSHKTRPGNKWEVIKGVISVEWGDDDSTLFYTVPDQLRRPWRVYRHRLGTDTSEDQLIYEEPDHAFFVDVGKTKDKKFVSITSNSKTTSEVRVLPSPTSSTATSLCLIHPRQTGLEYYVDHSGDYFYIITNRDGKGDYIVAKIHQDKIRSSASNNERDGKNVATSPPPRSAWEKVLEPTPGTRIEDVDVFNDHIVTYERKDGLPQLRVLSLNDLTSHMVSLPHPVCSLHPGGNGDYYSRKFRFSYSTPVEPECTFDYHIDNRRLEPLRVTNVPGHDPNGYECSRLHATSPEDGTPVPLTVFHKKGLNLDGSNPLLLLGYGAYSQNMEAEFRPKHIPLLMRGWVVALAHVRGGGEMGRDWYLQGKQLNKKNSFHDFMACARHLHQQGYSRPSLSAAKASSAGGLLLGAVYNMMHQHQQLQLQQNENKEDSSVLFKAMIMGVPFLDVMTAMMDPTLPLTIHEYDEWGNPTEDERVFRYIRSYDPYLNLMPPSAPSSQSCDVLLTTSTLDARVPYWQSAKWVAKMRSFSSSSLAKAREEHNEEGSKKKGVVLLRVNTDTGHAGEGGRYNHFKDVAFEYAFLFKSLGLSYSSSTHRHR
ncbi:Prolyl endopeptidase [Balamuthia mandrillaris]